MHCTLLAIRWRRPLADDVSEELLELLEFCIVLSALREERDLLPELFRGDVIARSLVLSCGVLPVSVSRKVQIREQLFDGIHGSAPFGVGAHRPLLLLLLASGLASLALLRTLAPTGALSITVMGSFVLVDAELVACKEPCTPQGISEGALHGPLDKRVGAAACGRHRIGHHRLTITQETVPDGELAGCGDFFLRVAFGSFNRFG